MENRMKVSQKILLGALGISLILPLSKSFADEPGKEEFKESIPLPPIEREAEPTPVDEGGLHMNLAGGPSVYMFGEEHTKVASGLFVDVYHDDAPFNFRTGVEGVHINAEQGAFLDGTLPGEEVEVNFIRVPFSFEYMTPVTEDAKFYVGGGPDIIHIDNSISDTSVGMHLGARVVQKVTDTLGIGLEGGYFWAEFDNDKNGKEPDLDSFYISTQLVVDLM
jgi:hypothetical protein